MKAVKLVTQDWKTRVGYPNETQWKPGVTITATGKGGLCTDGVVHSYRDEYIAALMNPTHANIKDPICIRLETSKLLCDDGTKLGTKSATPSGETVKLPQITIEQRVKIAIRCALEVYDEPGFVAWAQHWLDGSDRTRAAANAAAHAAANGDYAANTAMAAAYAAAYADYATEYAATTAANAAANAADAKQGKSFNLSALIQEVLNK